jgi:hypothetical protein
VLQISDNYVLSEESIVSLFNGPGFTSPLSLKTLEMIPDLPKKGGLLHLLSRIRGGWGVKKLGGERKKGTWVPRYALYDCHDITEELLPTITLFYLA